MAALLTSMFNKTTGTVCGVIRWAFFPKNVDPGENYKRNQFTEAEANAAQEYLEWCSFAYRDEDKLPSGWKMINIEGDDTQVIVGKSKDGKTAVVAFRGTESTRDCLKDVSIHLTKSQYFPGKVHLGFLNGHLKSYDKVTKELLNIIDANTTRSVVTGHSLGGALATLYSYRIHKDQEYLKTNVPVDVVSFGCPRVGDYDFCTTFDESLGNRYMRWVHETDIVTRYPLTGMGLIIPNYHQCGLQHYLSVENEVLIATKLGCPKSAYYFMAEWFENASAHGIFTSFFDHKCDRYKQAISLARETSAKQESGTQTAQCA